MAQSYLTAVQQRDQQVNALFRFLGARLEQAERGQARIVLPVTRDITQGGGLVAGGILATLADEAMGHSVISLLEFGQSTVTVEMQIRYLRAADPSKGGHLRAEGKVIKAGRTLCFTEAEVYHEDGTLLASAGGSFLIKRDE